MRLYIGLGVRGWVLNDPWHIGWGASRHAVNDVDEWLTVLEVTICQNSRRAPFLGCGFLGQISDVGTFFFNTNDITSKYFLKFYPLLVPRRHKVTGFSPWDYDTDAHKQLIFDKLKQSPFMTETGANTKLMRFPNPPFE
jgi:hypothetical protein